jgi:hypothetical protein
MIKSLIGLVLPGMAPHIRFLSLEKENPSFVSPDLRERHDDIVRRAGYSGKLRRMQSVYFILEF